MKTNGLILLLIFFIQTSSGLAKENITWFAGDFPPFFIHTGPSKGKGTINAIVNFYKERMPEYEHSHIEANMPRFMKQAQDGEQWCHPWLLKTPEREKFLYYSIPITLALSNHLIIKKSKLSSFGEGNAVALAEILKNNQFTGRVVKGRSYGKKIDALIEQHQADFKIKQVIQEDTSLLKMILHERIDYTINYPPLAEYAAHTFRAQGKFISIPIKEAPAIQPAYVGCDKTLWGRKVIDRINEIARKERNSLQYRQLVTELWLDENSSRILQESYDELMFQE